MIKKLFYLITVCLLSMTSCDCSKYDYELSEIDKRLDAIEGTSLTTIAEQIAAIKASLDDLKGVDAALEKLIDDLEAEAADLQQQLDENAAADAATKKALEDEIAAIKVLIAVLQAKDAELEQRYFELEQYINDEIQYTEEWASFTFATLEQYEAMQTELAGIKALIEQYKTDVTAEYTAAIKTAITASETSMKEWVNSVLAEGYYTKAEIDGKITALQTQVSEGDAALQKEIDDLEAALEKASSDLTAAYEKAIEDAVANGGIINEAIAAAVKTAQDNLQSQIDAINTRINTLEKGLDELKNNFVNRIQSLEYIPKYSDGKMGFDYATRSTTLYFRISPATLATIIKPEHVSAFARETENPAARGINPEFPVVVTEVNGDDTGVIEVKVVEDGETPFGTNFWKGENEAVIYIRITDSNGNDITSDMIPIVATGYPVPLGDITDATVASTGDVALVDGSFVSQDKIAEMTDAQKAAMVGVVFWTTKDTDPTDRTYPASLIDDKVMNADFPHCTHGLIVSLKNTEIMTWSNLEESVYENFQSQSDEYNPTTSDYVSICQNNNDGAVFYKIYGYQNTKVLKAYNDYCTANNKTGYIMNPVASLASFSEQNSAPEGSTGWYLPSTKELNILCNEDVDEIWNNVGSMRNKNLLNTIFSQLGVDSLVDNYYWSSSECDSDQGGANKFYDGGYATYPRKIVPDYCARYVCAF